MLIVERFPACEKLLPVNYAKAVIFEKGAIFPVTSIVSRPKIKPPKMNANKGSVAITKIYFHFFRWANSCKITFAPYFLLSLI